MTCLKHLAIVLVMDARGSASSRRVATPEDYFLSLGGERGQTVQTPVDWGGDRCTLTATDGQRTARRVRRLRGVQEIDAAAALACLAWWNSPEYRELAAFRHASTTTHSVSI
ncbi:MAG: hypothetical protein JHC66_09570, partial [Acidimicrobiia bacterium]|nr:hypothetical protein [Acidimicrobiia bacterium]